MPSSDKTRSAPDNDDSNADSDEQKRPGDESQATTEDFDVEGMGVAPKE